MPRSRFRWNPVAGRYIGPGGTFVTSRRIRMELDKALAHADHRVKSLAMNFRAGDISLREWRQAMREAIAHRHLYSAALARGGWGRMDQAAYGRVGGVVRSEYRYLERWVQQLARGAPLDGHFLNRATLYTQAGRETFDRAQQDVERERGMQEEHNITDDAARHCEGPRSCPGETSRGWVTIGKLVPIGRRLCGRRCRCRKKFRKRPRAA